MVILPSALGQQTATPMITPSAGTYAAGQLITITDATPGAVIYYGDHGVIPTTTRGTRYTGPFLMTGVYDTVNAIAIAPGMTQSAVVQVRYVVPPPPAATPVFVQPAGDYPAGQLITITDVTPGATIYIGVHGVIPTTRGTKYTGPFPVSSVETVQAMAVAPGYGQSTIAVAKYTAYPTMTPPVLSPPPGAYFTLPDVTVVGTGTSPGYYKYWTTDGSTPTQLSMRYNSPIRTTNGATVSAIAVQPYYFQSPVVSGVYRLKVQTPVFTPPGSSLLSEYTVTIADLTPGASIYYTTDGNTPSSSSTPYTGPITVSKTETLKAIATFPAYANSDVGSASFTSTSVPQIITTVAGDGTRGFGGDGGPAADAILNLPQGLVIAKNGDLYITDLGNYVVRKISADTGIITTVAGSTPACSGDNGDGGPAIQAHFCGPNDIAMDSKGNLFISDRYSRIVRKVDAGTGIISTLAGIQGSYTSGADPGEGVLGTSFSFGQPEGVAVGPDDNVYIVDNNLCAVYKVVQATDILTRAAGHGNCSLSPSGTNASNVYFHEPTGISFDAAGNMYVIDSWNALIDRFDKNTGNLTYIAGNGTEGYSGDGGPASSASINSPQNMTLDSAGNLYIADTYNQVIREVLAPSGDIFTIAGKWPGVNGTVGYSGDGGLAVNAQMNYPNSVAIDSAGNIYIADTWNNAIRKVNAPHPASSVRIGNRQSAPE